MSVFGQFGEHIEVDPVDRTEADTRCTDLDLCTIAKPVSVLRPKVGVVFRSVYVEADVLLLESEADHEPLDVFASGPFLHKVAIADDRLVSAAPEDAFPERAFAARHRSNEQFIEHSHIGRPRVIER